MNQNYSQMAQQLLENLTVDVAKEQAQKDKWIALELEMHVKNNVLLSKLIEQEIQWCTVNILRLNHQIDYVSKLTKL